MNSPLLIDACERELRPAFAAVAADEGTLWLLDEAGEALVPVWNSGPNATAIVGEANFRQPLTSGLISLVCVTEQALCENTVHRHAGQDPSLDRRLGLITCAMLAAPLRVQNEIHGVVSCVKLKENPSEPDPAPFSLAHLAELSRAAERVAANCGGPS